MNEQRTYTITTDEDGDALFEGITNGSYLMTIRYFGKKDITEVVEFKSNDEVSREFIMEDVETVPAE